MTKPADSERANDASHAYVVQDTWASGSFKNVHLGIYIKGKRASERCVVKVFKSGPVFEESFFDAEMRIVDQASKLIAEWNEGNYINRKVLLNRPDIWQYQTTKQKVLVEPFIENFVKFNSNSGWIARDREPWTDVMQALSHFSYHQSGEAILLCDLQGGVYKDGVIVTDPVIMSKTKTFGPADLGSAGITTFFARHVCNKYCRQGWKRPVDRSVHYPELQGTSMMATCESVPTVMGRPTMPHTRQGEKLGLSSQKPNSSSLDQRLQELFRSMGL